MCPNSENTDYFCFILIFFGEPVEFSSYQDDSQSPSSSTWFTPLPHLVLFDNTSVMLMWDQHLHGRHNLGYLWALYNQHTNTVESTHTVKAHINKSTDDLSQESEEVHGFLRTLNAAFRAGDGAELRSTRDYWSWDVRKPEKEFKKKVWKLTVIPWLLALVTVTEPSSQDGLWIPVLFQTSSSLLPVFARTANRLLTSEPYM